MVILTFDDVQVNLKVDVFGILIVEVWMVTFDVWMLICDDVRVVTFDVLWMATLTM